MAAVRDPTSADAWLRWACPRCGLGLEARGDGGGCPGCGWRPVRSGGIWWAAPELRPARFRPERRDHLEALARDHFWFPPRRRLLTGILDRHLDRRAGARAVDLGCGTGGFLPALRERFAGVAAVDAYGESLDAAGQAAPGTVRIQADVSRVPLAAGQFRLAVALDVLEHVEPAPFLSEAARLVEAAGWLLLSVPALPALWSELDEAAGHRCRYTRRSLAEELTAAGWELVHWTHYQAALLPLVWLVRRSPWGHGRRIERRPPGLLGRTLGAVNELEVRALGGLRLPWGSSLVALARKAAP